MLIDRLRSSAILISVVVALLYADANYGISGAAGLFLVPLLLFFALGTAWEMCGLLRLAGFPMHHGVTLVATGIVSAAPCIVLIWNALAAMFPGLIARYPIDCPIGMMGWITVAGCLAAVIFFLDEMKDYTLGSDPSGVLRRLVASLFVAMYVGLPMSLLIMIRGLGSDHMSDLPASTNTWGLAALLTMIIVTKSTDAGAYFTGKAIGRRKLIPRLSPGKTVEGSLGGLIVATLVAAVCLKFLFPAIASTNHPPLWLALVLGPSLGIAGMIGDLAESLVKRACGAKDSGNLLPGLGGVWDVTDSLIFAALPAFLCFAAVA